jgi:hypothetical protein
MFPPHGSHVGRDWILRELRVATVVRRREMNNSWCMRATPRSEARRVPCNSHSTRKLHGDAATWANVGALCLSCGLSARPVRAPGRLREGPTDWVVRAGRPTSRISDWVLGECSGGCALRNKISGTPATNRARIKYARGSCPPGRS